ncbi:MAG: hypothetical protein AB2693_30040 [Candidatus Thiodiazotropha sp.]
MSDLASEVLENVCIKTPGGLPELFLDLYDGRGNAKKRQNEAGAKEYRKANKRVQRTLNKAKEDCVGTQIEICLNQISGKKTYQMVKNLTSEKRCRVDSLLSRISLGTIAKKNKRFAANGQNTAQSFAIIKVVVPIQSWTVTAFSTKTIYN